MSYGWATVFTLAAWFAGLVIDVNVRVGDLGLRLHIRARCRCKTSSVFTKSELLLLFA